MSQRQIASVVIGLPGAFTLWAFDAIKLLAQRSAGREVRLIDRNDEIFGSGETALLYLTQFPSLSVIDAVAGGRLHAYVLVDSPADAAAYRMARGDNLSGAVRALSASSVANLAIAASPSADVVARHGDQPARAYIHHMAACLGLAQDDATLDYVEKTLAAGETENNSLEAGISCRVARMAKAEAPKKFDVDAGAIVDAAINPLLAMALDGAFHPIVWPTGLFLSGDRPNEPAEPVASVVGPARVILYGPYFHLPPGDYRVEITLVFSGRIDDIAFLLEIHGSSCLALVRIENRAAGTYRGSFRFQHRNPVDALEIRLRNERGAIEGEVSLVEMRVVPERAHFNVEV